MRHSFSQLGENLENRKTVDGEITITICYLKLNRNSSHFWSCWITVCVLVRPCANSLFERSCSRTLFQVGCTAMFKALRFPPSASTLCDGLLASLFVACLYLVRGFNNHWATPSLVRTLSSLVRTLVPRSRLVRPPCARILEQGLSNQGSSKQNIVRVLCESCMRKIVGSTLFVILFEVCCFRWNVVVI